MNNELIGDEQEKIYDISYRNLCEIISGIPYDRTEDVREFINDLIKQERLKAIDEKIEIYEKAQDGWSDGLAEELEILKKQKSKLMEK